METVAVHIERKLEDTREAIAQMQRELQELERQKMEASSKTGIEAWLGNTFESSCSLTPEFATFAKDFKRYLLKQIGREFELVNWSRGHFGVSGFLRNNANGKLVYFSISDVRHWPDDWYNNILIRIAKHDKDYTGGSNNYTTFNELRGTAIELTS